MLRTRSLVSSGGTESWLISQRFLAGADVSRSSFSGCQPHCQVPGYGSRQMQLTGWHVESRMLIIGHTGRFCRRWLSADPPSWYHVEVSCL